MNISYGPFGSGAWWYKKRALLEEFLSSTTVNSPAWVKYEHLICAERFREQPKDEADRESLLSSMASLHNFMVKGDLVKLMRWFSFFQCCAEWQGDFFATRMVMEQQVFQEGEEKSEEEPEQQGYETTDPKAELAALKKRKGTFALGPSLVTERAIAEKDILLSVCKAAWAEHANMARSLKNPQQILEYNIHCSGFGGWKDELVRTVECSLLRPDCLQHLLPQFCLHPEAVVWQVNGNEFDKSPLPTSLEVLPCFVPQPRC